LLGAHPVSYPSGDWPRSRSYIIYLDMFSECFSHLGETTLFRSVRKVRTRDIWPIRLTFHAVFMKSATSCNSIPSRRCWNENLKESVSNLLIAPIFDMRERGRQECPKQNARQKITTDHIRSVCLEYSARDEKNG
jgi:hypothetical protein